MYFADLGLARRLEGMDSRGGVDFARAVAAFDPTQGAAWQDFGGGSAVFVGVNSPVTQIFGLGLEGAVSPREVDALEDFFHRRGAGVNVELCPLADPGLLDELMRRGYRIVEFSNVLIRELAGFERRGGMKEVVARLIDESEEEAWADTIALGFAEEESLLPIMRGFFNPKLKVDGVAHLLVDLDGQPAGGGALAIHDRLANIFGTSTLPRFRGRGVQAAVIQASLGLAAAAGCDLAMATTMCGTVSQRNFERRGFRIVYTRAKLFRDWD
jgi:hypothetical protein